MDVISGTPGRVLSGITSYPDLIETIKQSFTSYSHEQATRISDHASQFTFYRSAQSIARRLHLDSKHAVTKTTCMESSNLLSAPLLPRDVCLNDCGIGNNVIKAIHDGLPDSHLLSPSEISGKHPSIVWGILRGSDSVIGKCQLHNSDWYHIDHSYLNRGHSRGFYRISYKSYSLGENLRLCDSSRLRLFDYSLRPWRKSGNSILVCPPTQYFSKYHRASNWLEETIEQLKLYTNRPIIVRHKPTPSNPSVPLLQQLDNAWALVTHSSNVAVEAVLDGVPAFVSDRSACASLGNTDLRNIDSPHYSDRDLWLANITHSQFSIEEFRRISDLIKTKDKKNKILSFDISSKVKIVLVSLKANFVTSDLQNLGAEFYDTFKKSKIKNFYINSDAVPKNKDNITGYFLHGLKLK